MTKTFGSVLLAAIVAAFLIGCGGSSYTKLIDKDKQEQTDKQPPKTDEGKDNETPKVDEDKDSQTPKADEGKDDQTSKEFKLTRDMLDGKTLKAKKIGKDTQAEMSFGEQASLKIGAMPKMSGTWEVDENANTATIIIGEMKGVVKFLEGLDAGNKVDISMGDNTYNYEIISVE